MKWNAHQTNNLITQAVEANEHTIQYTEREAIVLGHIFSQTNNSSKGVQKFGEKGLYAAL